jgi:Holliday junction DNA helicase RuvB
MLTGYTGQADRLGALKAAIKSAKKRNKPLPNMLFLGRSGLGKTRLAHEVADEMGKEMIILHAPSVLDRSDVSKAVQAAKDNILFIDEIHSLPRRLCEDLYQVIDTGKITLSELVPQYADVPTMVWTIEELPDEIKDQWTGPGRYPIPTNCGNDIVEREEELFLNIIGATTDEGLLPQPFLRRLGSLKVFLRSYTIGELTEIGHKHAKDIGVRFSKEAMIELAHRARFNPRRVKQMVDRAADLASARHTVSKANVLESLKMSGVDELGLEPPHRAILEVLEETGGLSRASLGQRLGIPVRNIDLHWAELLEQGLVEIDRRHQLTQKGTSSWSSLHDQGWTFYIPRKDIRK